VKKIVVVADENAANIEDQRGEKRGHVMNLPIGFVTLFGACDLSILPVAIDHGKGRERGPSRGLAVARSSSALPL